MDAYFSSSWFLVGSANQARSYNNKGRKWGKAEQKLSIGTSSGLRNKFIQAFIRKWLCKMMWFFLFGSDFFKSHPIFSSACVTSHYLRYKIFLNTSQRVKQFWFWFFMLQAAIWWIKIIIACYILICKEHSLILWLQANFDLQSIGANWVWSLEGQMPLHDPSAQNSPVREQRFSLFRGMCLCWGLTCRSPPKYLIWRAPATILLHFIHFFICNCSNFCRYNT